MHIAAKLKSLTNMKKRRVLTREEKNEIKFGQMFETLDGMRKDEAKFEKYVQMIHREKHVKKPNPDEECSSPRNKDTTNHNLSVR